MRPRQIPGTGLFVRGTGFDAEQVAGYNRDLARLMAYARKIYGDPAEYAAFKERMRYGKRAPGPAAAAAAAAFKGRSR